jgi:hypothetical protein
MRGCLFGGAAALGGDGRAARVKIGRGGAGEFGGAIGVALLPFRAHHGEQDVERRRAVALDWIGGRGGHRFGSGVSEPRRAGST